MPITPAVARPIGRASDSLNRIVCPLRDTRNTSSAPAVSLTSISSSPSLRLIAARPVRGESYSGSAVFLTMPLRVENSRYLPASYSLRSSTARDALVGAHQHARQVRRVEAARLPRVLGHLVRLHPVDLALGREEQQPVVGGRDEDVRDHVLFLQGGALDALAAAALALERVDRLALHVAGAADRDDHVLLGDQILDVEVADVGLELRAPRVRRASCGSRRARPRSRRAASSGS